MEINLGNVPPIFAHDIALSTLTKSKKKENGKQKKESFTEMVFIDAVRKTALARMVLPASVIEELPKIIEDYLKKLKKDLRDKNKPLSEAQKEKGKDNRMNGSYLG
jgi:hypothetical protein